MSGGRFEFDDGGYYVGEWDNGNAEGHGVCTGPSNMGKFKGLWHNGSEVSGVYQWPNGTVYKGQWRNGSRCGFGQELSGNITFSGEWINGMKHGSGINQIGPKKRISYEGTWKDGLQDGHGVEIYKDGGFYAGQWKEGYRHGFGMRGDADVHDLTEGSASIRQLLNHKPTRFVFSRPYSFTPANNCPILEESTDIAKQTTTAKNMKILRKSMSTPEEATSSVPLSLAVNRRQDITSAKVNKTKETYKGSWVKDMRDGYGICCYGDGSRYIGHWKDNKRHGYGYFLSKDGKKSVGKWYNDTLLLITRLKNLKLPLIKRKTNNTVEAAMEAVSRANAKVRLAITRGIAAKQVADSAFTAADGAVQNSKKAYEVQRKYTLHPSFEASISSFSQESSSSTVRSCASPQNTPTLRVPPNKKGQVQKSALLSAMDITMTAGAMSPVLSHTILLHSDDQDSVCNLPLSTDSLDYLTLPDTTSRLRSSDEEARLVKMRARLLSGDDVVYNYVAVNMTVDGKETQVLHTEHPKPTYANGYSISEKNFIESSTGLYRTVVGSVPTMLNAEESRRPLSLHEDTSDLFPPLKSQIQLENNTARASAPERLDTLANEVLETLSSLTTAFIESNSSDKLAQRLEVSEGLTTHDDVTEHVDAQHNDDATTIVEDDAADVGTSPTNDDVVEDDAIVRDIDEMTNDEDLFEPDVSASVVSFSTSWNAGGNVYMPVKRHSSQVSWSNNARHMSIHEPHETPCKAMARRSNSVNIVMRPHRKQVLITQASVQQDDPQTIEDNKQQAATVGRRLYVKHPWRNDERNSSLRSVSTDSGYKHSFSIDDGISPVAVKSPRPSAKSPRPIVKSQLTKLCMQSEEDELFDSSCESFEIFDPWETSLPCFYSPQPPDDFPHMRRTSSVLNPEPTFDQSTNRKRWASEENLSTWV